MTPKVSRTADGPRDEGRRLRDLRRKALDLAKRITLEDVRDDQELADEIQACTTEEEALPLLEEAVRRGWPGPFDFQSHGKRSKGRRVVRFLPGCRHPLAGLSTTLIAAVQQEELDEARPLAERARRDKRQRDETLPKARGKRSRKADAARKKLHDRLETKVRDLIERRGWSDRSIAAHLDNEPGMHGPVTRETVGRIRRERLGLEPADVQRIRDDLIGNMPENDLAKAPK